MNASIDLTGLSTESDVEQKVIWPMITAAGPHGLGLPCQNIFTKSSIRSIAIDKGKSKKNYYPDYVYVHSGVPVFVIEAKAVGEDLVEALREARLYAAELNAKYSQQVDPVRLVMACNGERLLAGYWNSGKPEFDIPASEFSSASLEYAAFIEAFGYSAVTKWGEKAVKTMRPKRFWKPRMMVGGTAAQNEEVGLNSFGTTIKTDFRGIFDPANIEERNVVASECYIPSKRRERYVDSIDRTFRAIVPPSEKNTTIIDDTSQPTKIIKKLRQGGTLTNQVMLLIGAAGAGKTTFIDHLRVKALPGDVRRSTRWVHINMNVAPVSKDEIYAWLRREVVDGIRQQVAEIDFDELDTLKKIFRADVDAFRKGIGRLFEGDQSKYNEKLAEVLDKCLSNEHYRVQAYCKYVSSHFSALLVIVLDNCDKRLLEEQLLMFEAAQWLRTEFNAMVFLPLREETYDNNLSVPPLDTALKDLAFRIEPPRFDLILRSRVDFAISKLRENPSEQFSYDLPNSMRATYKAADKISYLDSILKSVFDSNSNIRRLLIGLSGRNMRRAMEMFLEFCSSGHISEDHIVKMVQSRGGYSLPMSLVSRVILRSKKRYYDSDYSYVVNLFSSDIDDERPNYFTRVSILRFLANIAHVGKGARKDGYTRGQEILPELRKLGVDDAMALREINYLAEHYCIVSEDFRTVDLSFDDLITISPAGRTHLYMLGNPHYLAAVSEDTWFREEAMARAVVERVKDPVSHFENRTALQNAKTAVKFFKSERDFAVSDLDLVFADSDGSDLISVSSLEKTVNEREGQLAGSWAGLDDQYPEGSVVTGVITNKKHFGIFVKIEDSYTGLLHLSKCNKEDWEKSPGDRIDVRVLDVDVFEKKISFSSKDFE